MYERFEIIPFLNRLSEAPQNGRVHILGKQAEWCLDIVDGRVVFSAHSLQYLRTLETALPSLGYEAALPVYWRLIHYLYRRHPNDQGLETLNWTSKVMGALVHHKALTLKQAESVLFKLTEDAIESLLGLELAAVTWHPLPKELWHVATAGAPISSMLSYVSQRLRAWQPVCDRIYSPHQRPYCENTEELYQQVPQGLLSNQMLGALARLMQGSTIRQLAQSVKQDEAKLAQLLYPYIQHRVIKLWSPLSPFDRLPWLPGAKLPEILPTADTAVSSQTEQPSARLVPHNPPPSPQKLTAKQPPTVTQGEVTNYPSSASPANSNGLTTKRYSSAVDGSSTNSLNANNPGSRSSIKRSSTGKQSRYLIVCIDDSQAMLEKIESYLDPEHFELKTIIDPVASVSKICSTRPDLVLMDVSMPSINGNSLCQILKRSYMFKDVPIIMISSNASPLNKATAQSAGATDYLEKPFSKMQLMNVLETYLETQLDGSG